MSFLRILSWLSGLVGLKNFRYRSVLLVFEYLYMHSPISPLSRIVGKGCNMSFLSVVDMISS